MALSLLWLLFVVDTYAENVFNPIHANEEIQLLKAHGVKMETALSTLSEKFKEIEWDDFDGLRVRTWQTTADEAMIELRNELSELRVDMERNYKYTHKARTALPLTVPPTSTPTSTYAIRRSRLTTVKLTGC